MTVSIFPQTMSFNEKIGYRGRPIYYEAVMERRRRELARWIEVLEDSHTTFLLDSRKETSNETYVMGEGISAFYHTLCMDMVIGVQFHNHHIQRTKEDAIHWIEQMEDMAETALNQGDWFWGRMWSRLVTTCHDIMSRYENDIGWEDLDNLRA